MRAAENDFEGYSDDNSTGKGREGAFVRVHAGRGQATFCAGAHRKWSGSLHQRAGAAHAKDANGRWSRRCEDGEARKSAAHAQDADGQWNRRCEDGGARKRCEDGGAHRWQRNEQSAWALLLRRRGAREGRQRPVESTVKTAWRKRMTQTVSGIDGVKTVGRARGVKTVGCAGSSAASKAAPSGVPWTRWRGP